MSLVHSLSILWNGLRSTDLSSSMKAWYNLVVKPSSPGFFFVGRFFFLIAVSNSLLSIDLCRVSLYVPGSILVDHMCHFFPRFSNLLECSFLKHCLRIL
jgi:hypothetical protein